MKIAGRLGFKINEEQERFLKTTAFENGISISNLVRSLIDKEMSFEKGTSEERYNALQKELGRIVNKLENWIDPRPKKGD